MTKDDLIWVVIRGAGFVLLVRAVLYIPEFVAIASWIVYFGDIGESMTEGARLSHGIPRQQIVYTTAYLICYGALGVYLLRGGAWIHRLLRYVGRERSNTTPHSDARDVPPSAESAGPRAGGRER
jgi:hypothetical protein